MEQWDIRAELSNGSPELVAEVDDTESPRGVCLRVTEQCVLNLVLVKWNRRKYKESADAVFAMQSAIQSGADHEAVSPSVMTPRARGRLHHRGDMQELRLSLSEDSSDDLRQSSNVEQIEALLASFHHGGCN